MVQTKMSYECKLEELCDGSQQCFVVVRILRLWDCIIPPLNDFLGMDFLAVDSEGFAMHGCIPLDVTDVFCGKLLEGSMYQISTFEVRPRGKKTHLAVAYDHLLYFNISTVVKQITYHATSIPHHHFSFASYTDIMSSSHNMFYLTDVIGMLDVITDVVPVVLCNNRGTIFKREIFLTLLSLKISLIIEHGGFRLQTIVFGDLASRLTGFDMTTIDLAERQNFRKIPSVATEKVGQNYEFILGVLNQSYSSQLVFKIYRFIPANSDYIEHDN
ncbi:Nucleic acid-binding protein [Corchorus olitorius]|uniref:Nucleic acid-binding protein n=1 Tax=Corchorus olitorius TaxID=93759 RepID=A0A1R3GA45_9ROSI|nr:Nucleic acid-binding protein [Corchorus olitorius]